MLNDQHINYSLELIRKDFPEIKGLQSTLNAQKKVDFKICMVKNRFRFSTVMKLSIG